MALRSALRDFVYGGFRRTGINALVAGSRWRGERLLILCYHGFSRFDEHLWAPSLFITPDRFRRRLEILDGEGFRVLPLGEALHLLSAGTLPPRSVSITVDDGGKDFVAGYPVIREHRVPVTLYVSTYYVHHRLPVFDVCASYLLWKGAEAGRTLSGLSGLEGPADLRRPGAWQAAAQRIQQFGRSRGLTAEGKRQLLEQLAEQVGADLVAMSRDEMFYLLSVEDLSGLDPALVDVQLHTHRHRMPEDRDLVEREIRDNRAGLSACGLPPDRLVHFCYPSGVYHRSQLATLRTLGIRSATTCVPGLASRSSDPLLLPRFIDNQQVSEVAFRAWVAGTGALLRPRRIP